MPMPPQLQAARERSLAVEKAKEVPPVPPVMMLGLRKTANGYEVVRAQVPSDAVSVAVPAEPLNVATQCLVIEMRKLVEVA